MILNLSLSSSSSQGFNNIKIMYGFYANYGISEQDGQGIKWS